MLSLKYLVIDTTHSLGTKWCRDEYYFKVIWLSSCIVCIQCCFFSNCFYYQVTLMRCVIVVNVCIFLSESIRTNDIIVTSSFLETFLFAVPRVERTLTRKRYIFSKLYTNEIDILCEKYDYLIGSACVVFSGFSSAYDWSNHISY